MQGALYSLMLAILESCCDLLDLVCNNNLIKTVCMVFSPRDKSRIIAVNFQPLTLKATVSVCRLWCSTLEKLLWLSIQKLKSCYHRCVKKFFGYSKLHIVTLKCCLICVCPVLTLSFIIISIGLYFMFNGQLNCVNSSLYLSV